MSETSTTDLIKNPFEELDPDYSSYADDTKKLKEKISSKGYLFFRDLLNKNKVEKVRADIINILKMYNYVTNDSPDTEAKWTGKDYDGAELEPVPTATSSKIGGAIAKLDSVKELNKSDELFGVLSRLLDGEVYSWVDNDERLRVYLPGKGPVIIAGGSGPRFTPPHQDRIFFRKGSMSNEEEYQFYTVWMPIVDMDQSVGGLTIMKGAHKRGLFKHFYGPGADLRLIPFTKKQLKGWMEEGAIAPAGETEIEENETWLRTDFKVGDVLIFDPLMAHAGLTNVSKNLRISGDFRYSRKGGETTWQNNNTLGVTHEYMANLKKELGNMKLEGSLPAQIYYQLANLEGPTGNEENDLRGRIQNCIQKFKK